MKGRCRVFCLEVQVQGEAEEVVIVVQAHLIEINAQFNGDKHKSSYSVRAAGERVSLGVIQCRIMDVVQSIGADREEGRYDVCSLWCTSPYRQSLIQPIFLHSTLCVIIAYVCVCWRACVDTGASYRWLAFSV